jgi:putative endonuclease
VILSKAFGLANKAYTENAFRGALEKRICELLDALDRRQLMPEKPTKFWFLYAIECRDGTIYAGITTDPARRYLAHSSGKAASYTRARPPARMLFAIPQPDRSTAIRAELALKRLSRQDKLRFAACACASYDETGLRQVRKTKP